MENSITISLPAYNEEQTLEAVTKEAISALKKLTPHYEVLIINDGSQDKTGQIANKLANRNNRIRVIHHTTNQGFSGVITKALKAPSRDLVFLAPADGQFNFKELERFVKKIKNYDIVFGYRAVNVEPIGRKLQSWFFHQITRLLFGIRLKEITSTSLWRRKVTRSLKGTVSPRSNAVLPEFVYQALQNNYKITQVPIHWHKRRGGSAKGRINLSLIASTLLEMTKLYWRMKSGNYDV